MVQKHDHSFSEVLLMCLSGCSSSYSRYFNRGLPRVLYKNHGKNGTVFAKVEGQERLKSICVSLGSSNLYMSTTWIALRGN